MRTKFRLALAILAVTVSVASTKARAADIVGTWRMVSWIEEETESKAVSKPFGDKPSGLISYTADGHMMVFFADPTRKAPAAPKATDAEASALYRTMVAYTGTYSVEADKVTHNIEIAWSGTKQQRSFELKGDALDPTQLLGIRSPKCFRCRFRLRRD
jgi:Lipocalin-like domain